MHPPLSTDGGIILLFSRELANALGNSDEDVDWLMEMKIRVQVTNELFLPVIFGLLRCCICLILLTDSRLT